jgi:predicted phosphoadenosine phosphosulfate sulfurtransferase
LNTEKDKRKRYRNRIERYLDWYDDMVQTDRGLFSGQVREEVEDSKREHAKLKQLLHLPKP